MGAWDDIRLRGLTASEATSVMRCSVKIAKKRLAVTARLEQRSAVLTAHLRQVRAKNTMENRAYNTITEWDEDARIPLNDRLPHGVGLIDRPTKIKE
jgi:hypothetical protein